MESIPLPTVIVSLAGMWIACPDLSKLVPHCSCNVSTQTKWEFRLKRIQTKQMKTTPEQNQAMK